MTISPIFELVEDTVAALTPDVEPGYAFKPGPYDGPLTELAIERTDAALATRMFQVEEAKGLRGGDAKGSRNGPLHYYFQPFHVVIQYKIERQGGGHKRLRDMRQTDKARITRALRILNLKPATTGKRLDLLDDNVLSKGTSAHYLILTFQAYYALGSNT